jgi:hypothetical protein
MASPPYPPYPPFPPYPPYTSPPPYPPYPPNQPMTVGGGAVAPGAGPAVSAGGTVGGTAIEDPARPETGNGPPDKPVDVPPVSVFFNYGRYDIVDTTNEGLGSGQNAKLATFVSDATRARATAIDVNGFASPEDNLSNAQLPLHRATAVKNRLDQLFAAGPVKPTITVRTTSVLAGDQSTWPSLRRADATVTSRSA